MRTEGLDRLRALADLRAQKSGQALAQALQGITELEARADALRTPLADSSDIATAIARDRYANWRATQLRELNLEIANLRAAAEPLRTTHGRDRARAEVLQQLLQDRRLT
ncbi:MAG: hypothetical protein AAGF30_07425 [Pseudomonadota bacterium]